MNVRGTILVRKREKRHVFLDISTLAPNYEITPNLLEFNDISICVNYGNYMFLGLKIYA